MANAHLQRHKHETISLSTGAISHIWRPYSAPIRAVIIVQHGFAEYAECYIVSHNQLIHHLTASGYAVYALDMWGHGRSPGTRGYTHLGKSIQDHMELRRRALCEGRPVILFGHALGGLVTAGSTITDPGLLAGVIMTSPALPRPLPKTTRVVLRVAAAVAPRISIPIPKQPQNGPARDSSEHQCHPRHQRCQEKDRGTERQIRVLLAVTAMDTMETVNANLDKWTVPTLVLHGTADMNANWRESRKFVARIRSEDKTFQKVERGNRELLQDLEGDLVLDVILKWIEEHIP